MITKAFFIFILGGMTLFTLMVLLHHVIPHFTLVFKMLIYYNMVFLIGSVVAVYLFIRNLRLLINTRSTTEYNTDIVVDAIQLDESQQKLSDLAARYVLLFSV